MTSESIRIERYYPTGHRNRHTPRLCPDCDAPLAADAHCTRCGAFSHPERLTVGFPDRWERMERMERAAHASLR